MVLLPFFLHVLLLRSYAPPPDGSSLLQRMFSLSSLLRRLLDLSREVPEHLDEKRASYSFAKMDDQIAPEPYPSGVELLDGPYVDADAVEINFGRRFPSGASRPSHP